jgi:pilus assembly protein CpaB
MSNTRAVLISILVSAFAVILLFFYLGNKEKQMMEMMTPVEVLVAKRDIADGMRLDETMIESALIPQRYVQPGASNDPGRLLNRNINVPVLKGTQILESMFTGLEELGIANKIPSNKRAFSVFMTDVTAVGDLIQPGDMVDLLLTVEIGTYKDGMNLTDEMITKTILENVLVLAVNQTSSKRHSMNTRSVNQESAGNVFSSASLPNDQLRESIKTLTLALSPREVQVVNLSQELGTLSTSLRSTWDSGEIENVEKLSSSELLGIEKKVIPRNTPAWVEIRGSEALSRFGN